MQCKKAEVLKFKEVTDLGILNVLNDVHLAKDLDSIYNDLTEVGTLNLQSEEHS